MLRAGNHITLLQNGAEYFPALLDAIETAQQEIFLESYLYAADRTGLAMAAALERAALRGVRVHVVLDGFGARHFDTGIRTRWRTAGVHLILFRPVRWNTPWRRPRLRRMHRKQVVIDAQVAFIGGINIIDDSNAPGHPDHRYDYAVRIEGPLLADIYPAALRLWRLLRWNELRQRPPYTPSLPLNMAPKGEQLAQYLLRDNLQHRRDIEDAYLAAIRTARREIIIANAYFLPGHALRQALIHAAERGVRVVLLMEGRPEYRIVHLATHALYREFLDHGIEIREYHASFMHAKVAVVDGRWATIGSSNIDPFSLWLSREANIAVWDETFVRELHDSLCATMARGSHAIHRMRWRRIGWPRRLASRLAYGLLRSLAGIVGLPWTKR
jgi:cardiolipin synthase